MATTSGGRASRGGKGKAPDPPGTLCDDARAEWVRALAGIPPGDAARIDLTLLEVYCRAYARWLKAEAILATDGTEVVIRNDKGEVKSVIASPQLAVSKNALDQMCTARKQSGLDRALLSKR